MKNVFILALIFTIGHAYNQKSNISLSNGEHFEFKNGFTEWSEPINAELQNSKKNKSIPISIRVKFKKRLVLACHYYVEITNLSPDKKVILSYGNSYRDLSGNRIWKKVKLKPQKTYTGKILFAEKGFEPSDAESCFKCSWKLEFSQVKIK